MRCTVCQQGETRTGVTNLGFQRGSNQVVVRDVPADICEACTEFFVDEVTSGQVIALAEDAIAHGWAVVHYAS
ncbi:MAG: type II toxin-antitoxin system MqsA family antitoxin [Dehalococcoidia bacterium]|nr:type II toxin-antitoxin system MqsA family antitoxin [Dehalococcoidia bacterium]